MVTNPDLRRGYVRKWTFVALALAFSLLPASAAQAQNTSPAACQNFIARTMFPALAAANAFGPSGVYPVGYAPLNQPFATDPSTITWGYPQTAMLSYFNPVGPPQLPDPSLSAASILQTAQGNGALDAMAPDQQVNLMIQLAQLQNTEQSNRIQSQAVRQNAAVDMVNIQRVQYDLAQNAQDRSRNWRESYAFYAGTALLPTLTAICPTAGAPGAAGVLNPLANLGVPNFGVVGPGALAR
jgi:hypothetical protein